MTQCKLKYPIILELAILNSYAILLFPKLLQYNVRMPHLMVAITTKQFPGMDYHDQS